MPKPNKQQVTTGDLNIKADYKGLTTDVIVDGKIMYDNLISINYNEQWLMKQLRTYNVKSVEEVFYGGMDTSGKLYISTKVKKENV